MALRNLPSIPEAVFTEGDVWTPDLAYLATNGPVFDDNNTLAGHRDRIYDAELSNDPTAIKARVANATESLRVSVVSGLTVGWTSGSVMLPGGTFQAISAGQLVVADNATSFLWVDATGAIATGLQPPVIRRLLAVVVASGGAISSLTDLRAVGTYQVGPSTASIVSYGGVASTDLTVTNGQVLADGIYYCRDFVVPAGISCTISRYARIIASRNVTIAGTVTVTPAAQGVLGFNRFANPGEVYQGGVAPHAGGYGSTYPWQLQPYGSGGSQSWAVCSDSQIIFNVGNGGSGGGTLWVEAAGNISVTGTINADGSNATAPSISTGSGAVAGAGGGSGGLILLTCLGSLTVAGSGVLTARGGNGSNAVRVLASTTTGALGGLGGGGGYIVLSAPSVVTTGATLLTTAGTNGANTAGFTIAGSTVNATPTLWVGGGYGGGFAGAAGSYSAGSPPFNILSPSSGLTVIRQASPIGT